MVRLFSALAESAAYRRRLLIFVTLALLASGFAACRLTEYLSGGAGLPCLFKTLSGFACPGCGNTRALFAFSHLDFKAGLRLNPLCPLEFAYLFGLYLTACRRYVREGHFRLAARAHLWDWLVLAVIVAWWPLRNLWGFV